MERYTAEGLPLVVMIGRWQHIERLDDAFLDVDVAHTRRNLDSILSLIRSCAAGVRFDRRLVLGERWQTLKTPTLFVRGERDAFMRPRAEKAWETIAARNPEHPRRTPPGRRPPALARRPRKRRRRDRALPGHGATEGSRGSRAVTTTIDIANRKAERDGMTADCLRRGRARFRRKEQPLPAGLAPVVVVW